MHFVRVHGQSVAQSLHFVRDHDVRIQSAAQSLHFVIGQVVFLRQLHLSRESRGRLENHTPRLVTPEGVGGL